MTGLKEIQPTIDQLNQIGHRVVKDITSRGQLQFGEKIDFNPTQTIFNLIANVDVEKLPPDGNMNWTYRENRLMPLTLPVVFDIDSEWRVGFIGTPSGYPHDLQERYDSRLVTKVRALCIEDLAVQLRRKQSKAFINARNALSTKSGFTIDDVIQKIITMTPDVPPLDPYHIQKHLGEMVDIGIYEFSHGKYYVI